jgi:EpsI family protein
MSRPRLPLLALGVAMVAAAALAWAMTPHKRLADDGTPLDLAALIPPAFGSWREDRTVVPISVSPEVQATLDRIYSQTLTRTYIDDRGRRVMLSIAYGGTQSRDLQVHRPEVCYSAQGFQIRGTAKAEIDVAEFTIPVMRVFATQGPRQEPITYWVRLGDQIVRGNLEQGLARLRYGLSGAIPDGLLVRVSTIGGDQSAAYGVQDAFLDELLKEIPASERWRLVGRVAGTD